MSQKPNSPPGQEDEDEQSRPEYIIDETVTVSKGDPVESWDLDYDPRDEETHVIRAIARTENTNVQVYILPKEELEFIEDDENVWWEYRSIRNDRLKEEVSVSHEDEDPFYHDGDYVLAVKAIEQNRHVPDELKFSVKYRRE